MRKHKLIVAFLVIGLLSAACAGSTSSTTTQAAPSTTQPAPTTSAPGESTVVVDLVDYAFEGLPASVTAGTRLEVANQSATELHELVAFKLADGDERTAAELAALPPEEMGAAFGGPPATVLIAAPGGEQISAVGDGVLAEPGRYVIFCFIPTGIDPQEYLDALAAAEGEPPQIDGGGPPHFVNGMLIDLTVEG